MSLLVLIQPNSHLGHHLLYSGIAITKHAVRLKSTKGTWVVCIGPTMSGPHVIMEAGYGQR